MGVQNSTNRIYYAPNPSNREENTMRSTIDRYFLSHPRSVNESYVEHAGVAFGVSIRLFGAALAALVHAVIPCLFVTTASATVNSLHAEIAARSKPT